MTHSLKTRLTLLLPLAATLPVLPVLATFCCDFRNTPSLPSSRSLLITSAVSLPLFFLTLRWLTNKMLAPLFDLVRHADRLQNLQGDDRLWTPPPTGEVAILGNALNRLVGLLNRQQEADEREEIYRTLADISTDLIFWVSADRMTIHYISERCEELTGYRREEFYRDAGLLDRILHPDYRALWQQQMSGAARGSGAEPTDFALIHRQGRTVRVSHSCWSVWGKGGEHRGIRGRFSDVTHLREIEADRRTGEEELQLRNGFQETLHETILGLMGRLELNGLLSNIIARAAALMKTTHGFIYLVNEDKTSLELRVGLGRYETADQHPLVRGEGFPGHVWERGTTCTTPEMQSWGGAFPPPGCNSLRATVATPLTSEGELCGVIGLSYDADGLTFDAGKINLMRQFAELASLALDNTRLQYSAKRDIFERGKTEERLRKLSHAVMQSPVSIIITDLHGTIEFANPHVARLTGYEPDELLGKNPRILKSGLTGAEKYRTLWNTILAGEEWRGELQNRKKNGQLYWQRVLISPVRDQNGVITHFMAINEDISDLKIMENQMRHAQKMEAIGQLAGGIAHDFNNILTAIIGYGNILVMKSPADSFSRSTAEQILAAAERGASLTKGLQTFSRKQVSTFLRIDLNSIIERIDKLLTSLVGNNIGLTIRLSQEPLCISADGMQMEQVLINLVSNARDVLPDGGSITVTTELADLDTEFTTSHGIGPRGRYALLTVADTGQGMDDETLRRIFDPFYTTKESGKGTGLGLSIVYGIVMKHQGHVICGSTPDEGTRFRIYLPLMDEETTQHAPPVADAPARPAEKTYVILADGDPASRNVTRQILEEFGYTVIEAADAGMIVQKCRDLQDAIGLVVLDGIISGARGLKTLREIRAASPGNRVVLCADPQDSGTRQLLSSAPEISLLPKPFTPKELLMKIREVARNVV